MWTEQLFITAKRCAIAALSWVACSEAWSQEMSTSPLSMRYAPKQERWLATTAISSEKTDAQLRSILLNDDGTSRYGLISQSLDYGLADTLTVSVTEVYAHAYETNSLDTANGRVGFRSPKFQLTSWRPVATDWTLKSSAGLQFNPSISSNLNYGFVAGDVLWQPTASQTLSMGVTYTAHKDIDSHSQSWRLEWGSSWGEIQLRLKHAQSLLAGFDTTQGPFEPSRYKTWEVEIGRPLVRGIWGSLGYVSESNTFRWAQVPFLLDMTSKRHVQRITVGLKWVWD